MPGFRSPLALTGRYYLYVKADTDDVVFEDGRESNNLDRASNFFDVMPIPYADLVTTSLSVAGPGRSGRPLEFSWRVENQGIGLTDQGSWSDHVWLTPDLADLSQWKSFGSFRHMGQLSPGAGYNRTATIDLPDGLTGRYYLVLQAAGDSPGSSQVFEFIHADNNRRVSDAFDVQLTESPDLVVKEITVPTQSVGEGTAIDIKWTVENRGNGVAAGSWEDSVVLRRVGDPNAPAIALGTYGFDGPLDPGKSYSRWEQVRLPVETHGVYEAVVTTNYRRALYEAGEYDNNRLVDEASLEISVKPRPDLYVLEVIAPTQADPGQAVAVEFVVVTVWGDGLIPDVNCRRCTTRFRPSNPRESMCLLAGKARIQFSVAVPSMCCSEMGSASASPGSRSSL